MLKLYGNKVNVDAYTDRGVEFHLDVDHDTWYTHMLMAALHTSMDWLPQFPRVLMDRT